MKKSFATFIVLYSLCSWAFASKQNALLLDYDRLYVVDITVDTTLIIKNINQTKKSKKDNIRHKTHCNFKILYLWKGNHVVRALVNNMKKVANVNVDTLTKDSKFFTTVEKQSDDYIIVHKPNPLLNTTYFLKYNNSFYTLNIYNIDILSYRINKPFSAKQPVFISTDGGWSKDSLKAKEIYGEKSKINHLKNFIYTSLFNSKAGTLLPANIPSQYAEYKPYLFNDCYCSGYRIEIERVSNVEGKAIYYIQNELTLYIPHVLYLPYKNFKYKIKSINGLPLHKFLAQYVDNFKAPKNGWEPLSTPVDTNKTYSYGEATQPPIFPGGDKALKEYIYSHLQYPDSAKKAGIEGNVAIRFIINKNGYVSKTEIVRSLIPNCDAEALRVVKTMPAWVPGRIDCTPVDISLIVPIKFKP